MHNKMKERLLAGKACVNGWLAIPSGFSAEAMARCGWDGIVVDLQHGVQDYMSMVACFHGMQGRPVTPLVRVPWNEPGIIGKVLDAGAWGLICPMINTADEARALVDAAMYPPLGNRSNGPVRAVAYGGPGEYQNFANDELLIFPMIETAEGVENLDAILDVPGISGLYVGPSDLSFSMGLPPVLDVEEPQILKIYERMIEATNKRGQFAGIHNSTAPYAAKMIRMGFRLVSILSDSGLLMRVGTQTVNDIRSAGGEAAR